MSRCRKQYCNISSLRELQQERERLDILLDVRKESLCNDWEQTKHMFSFSRLSTLAMGKVYATSSLFRKIMDGYNCITRIIKKRRNPDYYADCGCDSDYDDF